MSPHPEPAWVEHAIWWHVYPLGFAGAHPAGPPEPHRLRRIGHWLDYALELGVSGLALGPVFPSHTHGYDTIDHFAIDPRLGDDADFEDLVRQVHDRGMRLLLDGVFNHVGRDFPRLQEARRHGGADAQWFRGEPGEPFVCFEGHEDLVVLNHDNPAVRDYVVAVLRHWLARGADGWRLDAAYAVPTSFWADVLPRAREQFPEAYFVGEVLHGDYGTFVTEARVDAVTQYELWKSTWSALNDANFFELDWTLQRHNNWLDTFVPFTFVGNHDVTRIASQLRDERHLGHALAVLATVAGTPAVYYGDEQAFTGVKEERFGGDDEVRPEFPPSPDDLAPFGWDTFRLHQELLGLRRRHPWLHRARTTVLNLSNEQFAYAASAGGETLVVALNVGAEPWHVDLPAGVSQVLAAERSELRGSDLVVGPHAWAVAG